MRPSLFVLVLALCAESPALAQGQLLLVEDFTSGGEGWTSVASALSSWHVTSADECGLPAHVAIPSDAGCSYGFGTFYHADFLSPPFVLEGLPPYEVCVDAWIELDPSEAGPDGASVWIVEDTGAPGAREDYALSFVAQDNTTGFARFCGELPGGASWRGERVRLRLNLQSDGIDGQGRGFLVDRVEVTNRIAVLSSCAGEANACPCGDPGLAGSGCNNSAGTGGAFVEAVALETSAAGGDTLGLAARGLPPGDGVLALVVDAPRLSSPTPFGAGLLCVGGAGTRVVAASSTAGGSASLRVRPVAGEGTRHYQVLYRDSAAKTCAQPGVNSSNALSVAW